MRRRWWLAGLVLALMLGAAAWVPGCCSARCWPVPSLAGLRVAAASLGPALVLLFVAVHALITVTPLPRTPPMAQLSAEERPRRLVRTELTRRTRHYRHLASTYRTIEPDPDHSAYLVQAPTIPSMKLT